MSIGNLEMLVHSACPKYYLFLICNVIGTEIEFKCLETFVQFDIAMTGCMIDGPNSVDRDYFTKALVYYGR